MKITMIQFSPSGNTLKVSIMLKRELEKRGAAVQLLDITGAEEIFIKRGFAEYLDVHALSHDVLLVGGPVYAHHLQYHLHDLIKALPKPDDTWGKYAVPYVTYGGISSGVALAEASALLKKSGRIVPCGLKVSAPHCMTRAFMPVEFNSDKLKEDTLPEASTLADRVMALKEGVKHASLRYNGFATALKARFIFNEKLWHRERYPKVSIDTVLCTNCGRCAKICPVRHLEKTEEKIIHTASACIHCFSCVMQCPSRAIMLTGNSEKGKAFMAKMIAKSKAYKELPESAVL